jgi:hypothetical protein
MTRIPEWRASRSSQGVVLHLQNPSLIIMLRVASHRPEVCPVWPTANSQRSRDQAKIRLFVPCLADTGTGTAFRHDTLHVLEPPPDTRGVDSLCHSHVRSVKRVRSEVSLAALYASLEDEAERLAGGCRDKDDGLTAAERRDRDIDLKPGVYTSTEPAWNNMNLVRLSEKLR